MIELRENFPCSDWLQRLRLEHAISIPLLSGEVRVRLLDEALSYRYTEREKVVGRGKVRQEFSAYDDFFPGSLFTRLGDQVLERLQSALPSPHESHYPFFDKLWFNDLVLQRYKPGPVGITPHVDHRSRINLICVVNLCGSAKFCLCENRSGDNPREIDASPGKIIVMRAPGFDGSDFRPFHFVSDVSEMRISFALRQRKEEKK